LQDLGGLALARQPGEVGREGLEAGEMVLNARQLPSSRRSRAATPCSSERYKRVLLVVSEVFAIA